MKFTFIFRREPRRRTGSTRIAENFIMKRRSSKIYYRKIAVSSQKFVLFEIFRINFRKPIDKRKKL